MDEKHLDFYRQQYALLMRAILTAIDALDGQEPERARKNLTDAWDNAVAVSHQVFISEAGR